jgi:hypothetical protein
LRYLFSIWKNEILFWFFISFPLFIRKFWELFTLIFTIMEYPDHLYPLFNHPVQRRLPTYILAGFALAVFWMMTNRTYYRKTPEIYGDLYYQPFANGKFDECNDVMRSFIKSVWFGMVSNFFMCLQGLYVAFIFSIISFACIGEFHNNPYTIIQRYASIILIFLCSWECIAAHTWYIVYSLIIKIILCYIITSFALADLITTACILVNHYGFLN